jgi:hypothetical protein
MTFQRTPAFTQKFTAALIALLTIETVYHSVMDEEIVHQLSWLLLLILVATKTRGLIKQRVTDEKDKARLSRLIAFGAGKVLSSSLSGRFTDLTQLTWPSATSSGNSTASSALSSQP